MIKYATINGYDNYGEVELYSHIYQFLEQNIGDKKTILIHGYDISPAKVFKGYIYMKNKTYKSIAMTDEERKTIEQYVGEFNQLGFLDFIQGSSFEEFYQDFKKSK